MTTESNRTGTLIPEGIETHRKSVLFVFIVIISYFVYLLAFFFSRTNVPPVGAALASLFSQMVVIVFPVGMYCVLFIQPVSNENITMDYVGFAASISMGMIHIVVSSVLLSYTIGIYPVSLIIALGIIPGLVILLRRRNMRIIIDQLSSLIDEHFRSLLILFSISMIIRFPLFTSGETGSDSFLFHSLTSYLLQTHSMGWIINPLDIIEWSPTGKIVSPITFVASFAMLSGQSIETCAFLFSLNLGVFASFTFIVCAKYASKILNIGSSFHVWVTSYLFATLPLLVKFSDWTISGRLVFLYLAPALLVLTLYLVYRKNISFRQKTLLWGILIFASLLSHGMGRLFLSFSVLLFIIERLSHRIRIDFSRIKITSELQLRYLALFAAIILFLTPYIFSALGSNALLGSWMFTRSSLTDMLGRTPLTYLVAFAFIFAARTGFATPFILIGIASIPWWPSFNNELRILALALFLYFPFFGQSMYFYQTFTIVLFIIMGFCAFPVIERALRAQRFRRWNVSKVMEILPSRKTASVLLVLICFATTTYIQYYRYTYEEASTSPDLIEISKKADSLVFPNEAYLSCNNSANWKQYENETNDHLSFHDGILNFTSYFDGNGTDYDFVLTDIPSVRGRGITIEIRCDYDASETIIGPYVIAFEANNMTGRAQKWTIGEAENGWATIDLNVTEINAVECLMFEIATNQNKTGLGNLLVDYVYVKSQTTEITALASDYTLANRLIVLSNFTWFPIQKTLFMAYYRDQVDITYTLRSFHFTVTDMINLFRAGPFTLENPELEDVNRVATSTNVKFFLRERALWNMRLLCYDKSSRWPLLEQLVAQGLVYEILSNGEYTLYYIM